MNTLKSNLKLSILALLISLNIHAQENDKKEKWDVNTPVGPFKEVTIETEEGTWMNLDVSPDGKTIVFDMLGDIYIMPVSGGKARALRTGLPFEVQPRFSPDGRYISFTSDAGGGDNHHKGGQAPSKTNYRPPRRIF